MNPADSETFTVDNLAMSTASEGPRPIRSVLVERMGDELVLRDRRALSVALVVFGGVLVLWWIGWTVACACIIRRVVAQPDLENVLFAIPFLDVWFFVLLLMVLASFGRTEVRLGPGGLEDRWTVLGAGGERHVPLDEILGLTDDAPVTESASGRTAHGLRFLTRGRSVHFAGSAEAEERLQLIALINGHLRALRGGSTPANEPSPPSDSEITLEHDNDRLVFLRRSSPRCGAVAVLTFLNLFWNGGVAIFLLQLVKHFMWALFLFLIPFEIIGSLMLVAWLSALTCPWQRRQWIFRPEAITAHLSLFGFERTKTYDPLDLDQVELSKGVSSRSWLNPSRRSDEAKDRTFALAFVHGGWDAFVIDELTEGEARWMQTEVHAWMKLHRSPSAAAPTSPREQASVWDRWIDGTI